MWGGIERDVRTCRHKHKNSACLSSFVTWNSSVNCSSPFRLFALPKFSDLSVANIRMMNWKGIGWKRLCFVSVCSVSTVLRFWPVEESATLAAVLDVEKWRGVGVLVCLEIKCNKVSCTD